MNSKVSSKMLKEIDMYAFALTELQQCVKCSEHLQERFLYYVNPLLKVETDKLNFRLNCSRKCDKLGNGKGSN